MTEPDGSGAQAPVVPTGAAMSKFDRFSAVVMAALVGLVAVVAALYVFAARLRLGGGGILYVVLFLAVGGGSYILCAKLVGRSRGRGGSRSRDLSLLSDTSRSTTGLSVPKTPSCRL